jgi:hypothetical protein
MKLAGALVIGPGVDHVRRGLDAGNTGTDRDRVTCRKCHFDCVIEQMLTGLLPIRCSFLIGQCRNGTSQRGKLEISQLAHASHAKRLFQQQRIGGTNAKQGIYRGVGNVGKTALGVLRYNDIIDIHLSSFQLAAHIGC